MDDELMDLVLDTIKGVEQRCRARTDQAEQQLAQRVERLERQVDAWLQRRIAELEAKTAVAPLAAPPRPLEETLQ
jgi:phage shock protein A